MYFVIIYNYHYYNFIIFYILCILHRPIDLEWHLVVTTLKQTKARSPFVPPSDKDQGIGGPNKKARGLDRLSPGLPACQVDLDPPVMCGASTSGFLPTLGECYSVFSDCQEPALVQQHTQMNLSFRRSRFTMIMVITYNAQPGWSYCICHWVIFKSPFQLRLH